MKVPGTSSQGFSLMELMIVLVMLGFVAGVSAPAIGRILSGLDFRKDVGNIMAHLRGVRLESVVSGRQIELRLEDKTLLIDRRDDTEPEAKDLELNEESEITLEPETVIFTPQSTVTPAIVTFTQGKRSRTIKMDPLTALPVIE